MSKLPDAPPVLGSSPACARRRGWTHWSTTSAARPNVPGLKLAVGGGTQPMDEPFVAEQKDKLRAAGLMGDATFQPNIDRESKLRFSPTHRTERAGVVRGGIRALRGGGDGQWRAVVAPEDASFPEMIAETGAGVICEKQCRGLGRGDRRPAFRSRAIGQVRRGRAHCRGPTFNIQQMAEVTSWSAWPNWADRFGGPRQRRYSRAP